MKRGLKISLVALAVFPLSALVVPIDEFVPDYKKDSNYSHYSFFEKMFNDKPDLELSPKEGSFDYLKGLSSVDEFVNSLKYKNLISDYRYHLNADLSMINFDIFYSYDDYLFSNERKTDLLSKDDFYNLIQSEEFEDYMYGLLPLMTLDAFPFVETIKVTTYTEDVENAVDTTIHRNKISEKIDYKVDPNPFVSLNELEDTINEKLNSHFLSVSEVKDKLITVGGVNYYKTMSYNLLDYNEIFSGKDYGNDYPVSSYGIIKDIQTADNGSYNVTISMHENPSNDLVVLTYKDYQFNSTSLNIGDMVDFFGLYNKNDFSYSYDSNSLSNKIYLEGKMISNRDSEMHFTLLNDYVNKSFTPISIPDAYKKSLNSYSNSEYELFELKGTIKYIESTYYSDEIFAIYNLYLENEDDFFMVSVRDIYVPYQITLGDKVNVKGVLLPIDKAPYAKDEYKEGLRVKGYGIEKNN